MRTRPPDLRTLPSSTWPTLSSRATFGTSTCLPLYMNALLRETTASAETLLKIGDDVFGDAVAEVLLLLVAAHVGEGQDADADARGCAATAAVAATRALTVCEARCRSITAESERISSWNGALAGSSSHVSRSVVWIARASIGRRASSNRAGTRIRGQRRRALPRAPSAK